MDGMGCKNTRFMRIRISNHFVSGQMEWYFTNRLTGSEPGISRNLSYLLGWGHVTTQLEAIVKIPIN